MKTLIIKSKNGAYKHITAIEMESNCIDAMLKRDGKRYEAQDIEGNKYIVYGWEGYLKRRGYKYERV